MNDIVKRLHRQVILIGMVGGDKDLKSMLEEAKAEIIKLRSTDRPPAEDRVAAMWARANRNARRCDGCESATPREG